VLQEEGKNQLVRYGVRTYMEKKGPCIAETRLASPLLRAELTVDLVFSLQQSQQTENILEQEDNSRNQADARSPGSMSDIHIAHVARARNKWRTYMSTA